MVQHLAECLEVPLRERNALLLAAGYAPAHHERDLNAPEMAPVHQAIERLLAGHEPYPGMVVDRGWRVDAANRGLGLLTAGVASHLLDAPVNALRLAFCTRWDGATDSEPCRVAHARTPAAAPPDRDHPPTSSCKPSPTSSPPTRAGSSRPIRSAPTLS